MRFAIVALLVFAAMNPMLTPHALDEDSTAWFTEAAGVEVINEVEPNNANTSGQEVYPGDVV